MKTKPIQKNIPDGWRQETLGKLFEFKNGVNSEGENYGSGIRFINIMEILRYDVLDAKKIPGRVEVGKKEIEKNLVKYGDVLFNRTSETPDEVGMTSVYMDTEPVVFGGFVIRARAIGKELNDNYKKYCFSAISVRREIIRRGQGVVRGNIGQGDLEKVPLMFPPLPEQNRIVSVLETWDRGVESLGRKIEIKKRIKKGLMQKLLTGAVRLPGFTEKWETKRFGDVVEIKRGQLITDGTRTDGNIPVIAGGKTPAYFHNKANRMGKTITISGSGASAGYTAFHTTPIFASDCSTIEESTKYSVEFIHFFLERIQDKIYNLQTGGAQPHIHPSDLKPIIISCPNHKEQTAIANILTTADNEITALEKKLSLLKDQKKYLLNNLITGAIRTPETIK